MSALLGVGGGAGVVLAGPIVDNLSFHYLFWLPLIPIVDRHRRDPRLRARVAGQVAGPGQLAGAALMSFGLSRCWSPSARPRTGTGCRRRRSADRVRLVLLALWVGARRGRRQPLVDMRMMRIRGVWTTNAVALLLGFGCTRRSSCCRSSSRRRRAGYGFAASVTQAGLFLAPATLAMLIFGSQTGRLEKLFGSKPPLLAGGVLTISRSCSWPSSGARLGDLPRRALLGSGIGLAFAAMANLIIENVGPEQTGVATGMNTVTRTVGGGFGGAATASLIAGTVGGTGYPTNTVTPRRSRSAPSAWPASWSGCDPTAAARRDVRAAPCRRSLTARRPSVRYACVDE